mmetsp:Transcript_48910/g.121356  ORF Transcript_48910/g.121356 Transcript_48910/m.121356 type:complete len:149 (-) Transcript_48910:303-749(-)
MSVQEITTNLGQVLADIQQSQQQMPQQMQQMQQQLQQQLQQLQQQMQQIRQDVQQLIHHQGHNAAIIAARRATNSSRNDCDAPYEVVLMADLEPPPHWPDGLNRTALGSMNIQQVSNLLGDYGLATSGTAKAKRNRLAMHVAGRHMFV